MPLDPQLPLMVSGAQPQAPINPMQTIGALMQMRGQASEIALRNAQIQNQQALEQERQRKIQDETNLKKIVSDTFLEGGDWDKAFEKASRSGLVSPDTVLNAKTTYAKAVEQQAKTDSETLKTHKEALATLTPAVQSNLDNVDPAERQSQYQSLLQNSANSDNPSIRRAVANIPKQWDDQAMKELVAQALGTEKLLDHSLNVQKEKREAQSKTLTTDQGIMGFNPETGKYDIPQGQPIEKKTTAAATITTDEGVKQWNPDTQRYDIVVGKAPPKASGNVPAEQQFVDEYLKKKPGAGIAEAQRAYALNQHIVSPEASINQLDRETTRFAKPHEKSLADATAQLEKIDDARAMINGSAEAQALGIPKVLTALVSGQGSGVRITKSEMDASGTARGVVGSVDSFIKSVSGQGKLTATQKQQITGILDDVKARIQEKRSIANDAIDRINSARSRDEVINIDSDARHRLASMEAAPTAASSAKTYKAGDKRVVNGINYVRNDKGVWNPQ